MEGRFEQLIVIVVVIAFSLFDLLLRWAKRRAKQRQAGMPAEDGGELAFEEEVEDFETPGEVALEREEPWAAGAPSPPLPTETPPSAEKVPARMAPSRAPVGSLVPLPYLVQRPCRRKRWALAPGDARRGIVLMTVLGPCRAQEMDRR